MTRLRKLLRRDAACAGRDLALGLVRKTDAAFATLSTGNPEALHDFRVAARRLRAFLRAFRDELGMPPKGEKRLAHLVSRTGNWRDAEVAAAWVASRVEGLGGGERPGADWLLTRLRARRGSGPSLKGLERRWHRVDTTLRRHLKGARRRNRNLAWAYATHIDQGTAALNKGLAAIHSEADQGAAHRARIATKRLRYLLTPLGKVYPVTGTTVGHLTALQTVLGNMHDTHLLALMVTGLMAPDGPAPVEARAGLMALASLAKRERTAWFEAAHTEYLEDGGEALLAPLSGLCKTLGRHNR